MMMKPMIKIGEREVGQNRPAYIIAEIGSNHDCSIDKAKDLISACREAGADAVKFQSFTAEGLLNPMKPNGKGWVEHPAYGLIQKLTLPIEWHHELKAFCDRSGVTFLSAPFDEGRAELLNKLGVPAFKIASGELTNEPLLRKVASYKKPVILSTGASYLNEVKRAVDVITGEGCTEIALLECAALYPPAYDEVNIRAMVTLKEAFGCPVGFSDHTPGSTVPIAAITLGGSIIEKHVTFDRKAEGPDHPYAMEIDELKEMVREIRNLELALGDGVKKPSKSEMEMRVIARKSVYADIDIKKGTEITAGMLKVVRHAYGLEPKDLGLVIGKKAARDITKNMPVQREDICL